MVNLGGTQKVDFLGTCFGGDGLGHSWADREIIAADSAQVRVAELFGYLAFGLGCTLDHGQPAPFSPQVNAVFRNPNIQSTGSPRLTVAALFSPTKRITQTPAASHPTTWVILHFAPGVLQETLPSPHPGQRPSSHRGTTRFHTLPSPPPGLPHCRHSATRACHPHVHGYGLFPRWRENLATTCPSFRLRCSVLEPTRHMARTRAPDRHAKILPEPFTLPRALAGPRPAQNLSKA